MGNKISVESSKVEGFVERLDRPWLGTPFPLQGIKIESTNDVIAIKKHSRFVCSNDRSVDFDPTKVQLAPAKRREFAAQLAEAKEARKKTQAIVKSMHRAVRAGKKIQTEATQDLIDDLIPSLAQNSEALVCLTHFKDKDQYTVNHSINVCTLSLVFGHAIGLSTPELKTLGVGAIFHDIGKLKIPDQILNKPAKLTDTEYDVMRKHPAYGAEIVAATDIKDRGVIDIVLNHHEFFDGGGYPNRIELNQPEHLFSQIVSMVGVYDALTSDRVYREGMAADDVVALMTKSVGRQFNPNLFNEFRQCFGSQPSGSLIELNTGEIGVKIFTEGNHPVVLLIMDDEKNKYYPLRIIDFKLFENTATPYSIRSNLSASAYGIDIGKCLDEALAK